MSDTVEFRRALRVLGEAGYYYASVTRDEIRDAVDDDEWQAFRKTMRGKRTEMKVIMLARWYEKHFGEHDAWVQVTNYLNALKRGGLLV